MLTPQSEIQSLVTPEVNYILITNLMH